MAQLMELLIYIYLSICFCIIGIHGQSSHVIDTIRLPWDKSMSPTIPKVHNPLGDTIDIVDSSMVRTLPDIGSENVIDGSITQNVENNDVISSKPNVATTNETTIDQSKKSNNTSENEVGVDMQLNPVLNAIENIIDAPQNVRKKQNKQGQKPAAIIPETMTTREVIGQGPVVSAININRTPVAIVDEQINVIDGTNKAVQPVHKLNLTLSANSANSQPLGIDSMKPHAVPQIKLPSNLHNISTGTPFEYKTNFYHSDSFGHSSNFNMSWDRDKFMLQTSNSSFKNGNKAHNHFLKTDKDGITLSNKKKHSIDGDVATKLLRNRNLTRLSIDKHSTNQHSNEQALNVLTNGSSSMLSHNKTKLVTETDSFVNEHGNTDNALQGTGNILLNAMMPQETTEEFRTDIFTKLNGNQSKQQLILQQNKGQVEIPKRSFLNKEWSTRDSSLQEQTGGTANPNMSKLAKSENQQAPRKFQSSWHSSWWSSS